jgi:hypothetical protein
MMLLVVQAVAAVLAAQAPSLRPRPIGVGPAYRPAPAPPKVLEGRPVGRLRCTAGGGRRIGVHVEVFAHRRVVVVPAGIGVALPHRTRRGRLVPGGCSYAARTLEPTGVVEVRAGIRPTLGDLFRLWGQPLGRHRLAGFRTARPILVFVGGRRRRGDPRAIPLARHAQIVLELGGYVPPHPSFLFPGGL